MNNNIKQLEEIIKSLQADNQKLHKDGAEKITNLKNKIQELEIQIDNLKAIKETIKLGISLRKGKIKSIKKEIRQKEVDIIYSDIYVKDWKEKLEKMKIKENASCFSCRRERDLSGNEDEIIDIDIFNSPISKCSQCEKLLCKASFFYHDKNECKLFKNLTEKEKN